MYRCSSDYEFRRNRRKASGSSRLRNVLSNVDGVEEITVPPTVPGADAAITGHVPAAEARAAVREIEQEESLIPIVARSPERPDDEVRIIESAHFETDVQRLIRTRVIDIML